MNTGHNDKPIVTPIKTKQILQQHGIRLKKSLGQNFLTDSNILRKIVDAAELTNEHGVLEIGPGIGALTEQLAAQAKKVVAVEVDQRLIPVLKDLFGGNDKVEILQGDILKIDLHALFQQCFKEIHTVHVVANLPYYITTPILLKLLHSDQRFANMVVMIQKEVAERLAAKPGNKDYGSLSIAVQYYSEPEIVAQVPPTVFIPPPQVGSAVIRLKKRTAPPVKVNNEAFFFDVVKSAFAQRRKTIYNNLLRRFYTKADGDHLKEILMQAGVDPRRRGETLTMQEFALLSDLIASDIK